MSLSALKMVIRFSQNQMFRFKKTNKKTYKSMSARPAMHGSVYFDSHTAARLTARARRLLCCRRMECGEGKVGIGGATEMEMVTLFRSRLVECCCSSFNPNRERKHMKLGLTGPGVVHGVHSARALAERSPRCRARRLK